MKKDLVAFQLVKFLEARGVEKIFGLCGHTVIGFLDALKESAIHFVSVRHEQIAAHAADGYSRGKGCRVPGVLLTHLGPGLANASVSGDIFAAPAPQHVQEAIEAAVDFSSRYLTDRFLPDKALDLLDEGAAHVWLGGPEPAEDAERQQQLEQQQTLEVTGDLVHKDQAPLWMTP